MRVFLERNDTWSESTAPRVSALLQELSISQEEVLIVINGRLVPEDQTLRESDEVKILSVISGG